MKRRRRYRRKRTKKGKCIPRILNGHLYMGSGQRGSGGLSKLLANLLANVGDAIGI